MTKSLRGRPLNIDERVELGKADISDPGGRTILRTMAVSLTICGLTCEIESLTPTSSLVTIYAANRASTMERAT